MYVGIDPDTAAVEAGLDLPEDYFKKARDAVNTLTTSLEFEATNPKDADRFRKAEPAKEAVKAFIKDWASAPAAQGDRAHDDIVLAVRELGEFYKANGSRSRLSPDARESILAKLYDAKEALPPAPPDASTSSCVCVCVWRCARHCRLLRLHLRPPNRWRCTPDTSSVRNTMHAQGGRLDSITAATHNCTRDLAARMCWRGGRCRILKE